METYFHFKFSLASHSSQLGGVHANEIEYGHAPVVYVVLDKATVNHTRPMQVNVNFGRLSDES